MALFIVVGFFVMNLLHIPILARPFNSICQSDYVMYTGPRKRLKYFVEGERHPLANVPAWRCNAQWEMDTAAVYQVSTGTKASVSNTSQYQSLKKSQTKSSPPPFTAKNVPGLDSREHSRGKS